MLARQWKRWTPLLACVAGWCASTTVGHADTRVTADYIAIVVEAEDHTQRDDRWVLTEPTTPAQDNDPDGNHSDQAVGQAYLELLPDIRVTHDDEFGPPTAIWHEPGSGPQAHYPIDFPEAGRYYVHLRAYSTGTEDNGIHIGLNDDWPNSGARMQFCSAGQGWAWASNQRDSGGASCGVQKTIWVTVEEPGTHTFMISAREDGFEVDRIMLIKDLSDNTRICNPTGADDITCSNGSLENTDDVVDMTVEVETSATTTSIGDTLAVTASVRNEDLYDVATNVVLTLDLSVGTDWQVNELHGNCQVESTEVVCPMGTINPTGENKIDLYFTLAPLQSGPLAVTAEITSDSVDDVVLNNIATQTVTVTDPGILSELSATWQNQNLVWIANNTTTLPLHLDSVGVADASEVTVDVSFAEGLVVSNLPDGCEAGTTIVCTLDTLPIGQQQVMNFSVTPGGEGFYSASVSATASNHDGAASQSTIVMQALAESDASSGETDNKMSQPTAGGLTHPLLGLLALFSCLQLYRLKRQAFA